MSTALVWLRRDLRLADNPALDRARRAHRRIVPVFVWDPEAESPWQPGAASRAWLHHSLQALADRLQGKGAELILRRGESGAEIQRLLEETGAAAIYWNRLYEPALARRDAQLRDRLRKAGVTVETCNAALLWEPWEVSTKDGGPYRVFTPYWNNRQRHWDVRALHPEPRELTPPRTPPASLELKQLELLPRPRWDRSFWEHWTPGEAAARARLETFHGDLLARYPRDRDRPDRDNTSRLSPHLHFGELSPHQIAHALDAAGAPPSRPAVGEFLREIAWREFAHHLLHHFPQTTAAPLQDKFKGFSWWTRGGKEREAWQRGATGIPLVDAGMRQLWTTGWMHNRVRMIVASLLTKNLGVHWLQGARWFWDTLVDADLANNTLGWQWVAGCGADAQPFFRIFNPVSQGRKFDPDGEYTRRWVPELNAVAARHAHAPWQAEGVDPDYPPPVCDLQASRRRALQAFEALSA